MFVSSTILPSDQPVFVEKLNEWAGCESDQKWKLLYKGSRDGFQGTIFHYKCDDRGATYTIAKSGHNIFGGYNPLSWTNQGGYSNGKHSFLFSLVNCFDIPPIKLKHIRGYGALHHGNYLPIFGSGDDIQIHSDCNVNQISFTKFRSYENPTGKQYMFTGTRNFQVDEIEVFVRM